MIVSYPEYGYPKNYQLAFSELLPLMLELINRKFAGMRYYVKLAFTADNPVLISDTVQSISR